MHYTGEEFKTQLDKPMQDWVQQSCVILHDAAFRVHTTLSGFGFYGLHDTADDGNDGGAAFRWQLSLSKCSPDANHGWRSPARAAPGWCM